MDFLHFKEDIIRLAKDEAVELNHIQAVITKYYADKAIPYLESLQKFVVR